MQISLFIVPFLQPFNFFQHAFLGLISDWITEEMMLKKRNLEGIAIAGDLHGQMGGAPRESGCVLKFVKAILTSFGFAQVIELEK